MSEKSSKPFLAQLRALEVGGTIEQPVSKRSYVNSACVSFSLEWNKKFKTSTNRERRIVVVTRIA